MTTISILANVQIRDYEQFMAVFTTNGKAARQRHGCQRAQVFTLPAPEQLVILFDWSSRADFEGFLADQTVKETMQASGTVGPPTFTFLTKTAELPA
ncbi:hypothetical protein M0L20_04520 [Spirosoma sp. RP8]|uniref:ABM domain-containing protein n=1 Tax=Spirosoma liriopis TaxID=2937440 RepID=A0ABT0HG23_9BACT|nr:antibiotic biosynthesis monooxygenase [Spirosoma liriopis]MCK8491103.1 hypothetical protein [Spirosoma liriopis]